MHDRSSTHSVYFHKNCVSTSKTHIQRYGSKHSQQTTPQEPQRKKIKRSDITTFDFRGHCLFCGEECKTEVNPRHPDRWRRVVQCRTANRGEDKTFKQGILDVCDQRNDEEAQQVRLRVQGAVSDLHAADAQYHKDCEAIFMSPRNIQAAKSKTRPVPHNVDKVFEKLVDKMSNNDTNMWNSVELHETYKSLGGNDLSRTQLIQSLSEQFGSDLLVLFSPGVANLIAFRKKVSGLLKLVPVEDDDDNAAMTKVAQKIVREAKMLNQEKSTYQTRISKGDVIADASPTLMEVLLKVSSKFDNSLQSALIGNIVTNVVTKRPTPLQISLGVVLRDKAMIERMHEFGVCCSYEEVRRFKASAAYYASKKQEIMGLNADAGLVQAIADTFDANISSQNGLRSTHALALLLTQAQLNKTEGREESSTIRRIKKEDMTDDAAPDVEIQRYIGPKKQICQQLRSFVHHYH